MAGLLLADGGAGLALGAAAAAAALAAWVGYEAVRFMTAARPDHLLPTDTERARRAALRRHSRVYRYFEPVVDRLAAVNRENSLYRLDALALDMSVAFPPHRHPVRWEPEEYMGTRQVAGVWRAGVAGLIGVWLFGWFGGAVTAAAAYVVWHEWLMLRPVRRAATAYRADLRARLPYAVELMALMLESGGADIGECVKAVVGENTDHPLGEEFGELERQIKDGIGPDTALQAMADRVRDDDVYELASTIRMSRSGGTTIEAALRNLAEQMRTRRVQRLERAAEEAKVHITWPGMGVMVACLLIVAAPFLLAGWFSISG